jgi:hypothetical protein
MTQKSLWHNFAGLNEHRNGYRFDDKLRRIDMVFSKIFGSRAPANAQRSIQSEVAGQLFEKPDLPDWWDGMPMAIPFFQAERLPITYCSLEPDDVQQNLADFDGVLMNLLKQATEARAYAEPLIHQNCRNAIESAEWQGRDELAIATLNPSSVWRHLKPTRVYIMRRVHNEMDIYATLSCECDWDAEHGLQLVFRQGKQLTRVGPEDGHLTDADAWNIPDEQDKLLSAWKG